MKRKIIPYNSKLKAIAYTENSFKITGRGIVLELKHSEEGLSDGTKLVSEKSDKVWKVKARILFDHAVHEQKLFENEVTEYMLMTFKSAKLKQESIHQIKERESQKIYQYFISPINHEVKPEHAERLEIINIDDKKV